MCYYRKPYSRKSKRTKGTVVKKQKVKRLTELRGETETEIGEGSIKYVKTDTMYNTALQVLVCEVLGRRGIGEKLTAL